MCVCVTKKNLSRVIKYLKYLIQSKTAHGVHSPYVFKFIHELIASKNEQYYQLNELKAVRERLLRDESILNVIDHGAGSRVFKGSDRKVCDIVKHGTSRQKFSELYFKLVNFTNSKYIVELGTSVGLNTLYLAKANSNSRVITIEGSDALFKYASQLFEKEEAKNITAINDTFEQAFPAVLKEIPQLDLLFVDGDHQYDHTLGYFRQALTKKTNDSVFIFDDINWSEGMQRAWEEIKEHPEVTLSIDLLYVGIVFFRREQKQKEHFTLRF